LRHLVGGVEQYLALRNPVQAPVAVTQTPAAAAGPTGAQVHAARKNVQRIERRIAKIEELLSALSVEVETAAADYERLQGLLGQMSELTMEKQSLEEEWLESAEIASQGQ
jgi:hypothetical protein